MKKLWLFLLIFNSILTAQADNKTKAHMQSVFISYIELLPYIYGTEAEEKVIAQKLQQLENAVANTSHDKMLTQANFSPVLKILKESIQDIKNSHTYQNHEFSKQRLKNVLRTCAACHTQLPSYGFQKVKNKFADEIKRNIKENYDQAMLAYFLRDYPTAINNLKAELTEMTVEKPDVFTIRKRLNEILKIYLMNLKDVNATKTFLAEQYKAFAEQADIRSLIKDWQEDLDRWSKMKQPALISEATLKKMIKETLIPLENEINYGNVSTKAVSLYSMQGLLSNFAVNKPESELMPEILYWLGLIENQSHTLYLYSLGDLYLKQCVMKYPKSKVANKCYQSYYDSTVFGFTGSSGTNIPKDIQIDLETLKKLLEK